MLTVKQVCKELQIGKDTAYQLIEEGQLDAINRNVGRFTESLGNR